MKIIQIIPNLGIGGAEIMCENLVYELDKNGNEVMVVSLYDYHSDITKRLTRKGIKIIYLKKKKGFDLSIIIKLIRLFKKEKPDVVHTHRHSLQYATIAAIFSGVKNRVHTVHSIAKKEVSPALQKIYFYLYHFCDVTPVALSEEIQETIGECYKLDKNKVPIIYNGIDLNRCKPKKSYDQKRELTYIHVGRFNEVKNHKLLVEAYKELDESYSDTKLVLVGDGPLRMDIEKRVEQLNLDKKVIFAGIQENVFPLLHDSDIFILPSLYEGMPMTIIEAMGTALPIIASNVGGIPCMIHDGVNGILISSEINDIKDAMIKLRDEKLREKYGKKNLIIAKEKFSAKKMALQYEKLYIG